MASQFDSEEHQLMAQWVATWRTASPELAAVRRAESRSLAVQEAVLDLFDGMDSVFTAVGSTTSGLVEQQMWFSRLRESGTAK